MIIIAYWWKITLFQSHRVQLTCSRQMGKLGGHMNGHFSKYFTIWRNLVSSISPLNLIFSRKSDSTITNVILQFLSFSFFIHPIARLMDLGNLLLLRFPKTCKYDRQCLHYIILKRGSVSGATVATVVVVGTLLLITRR